ncbi:MAG: hypothetical protein PHE73_00140 [Sulfurovaceae bacterium]|nr:hypothetical protein [Sulfurovaceae bacterium]
MIVLKDLLLRNIFVSCIVCIGFSFFAGCESKNPVYSRFCEDKNVSLPLSCIKVDIDNDIILSHNVKEALNTKISNDCPYRIEGEIHRASECSSIEARSTGTDFDGYVRLNIFDGKKCIYKIQSDFKNDEDSAIKRVLDTLKKELF